jgi:hypothetical protein
VGEEGLELVGERGGGELLSVGEEAEELEQRGRGRGGAGVDEEELEELQRGLVRDCEGEDVLRERV